jgi:hypothetical protein
MLFTSPASENAALGEIHEALLLLEPLLGSPEWIDPLGDLSAMLGVTAQALVWIEQWVHARRTLDRIIGAARTAGAPAVLPFPLAVLSDFELRRGKIAAAYAGAAESVQLAAEIGQTSLFSYSLVVPTIIPSAADLVEAQIGSGAITDAKRSLSVLEDKAHRTGLRWVNAGAARCRGMLADEDCYEQAPPTAAASARCAPPRATASCR